MDILTSHIRELLRVLFMKYFHPESRGAKLLGGSPSFNKTRLSFDTLTVNFDRVRLVNSNFQDEFALLDFATHVSDLVSTLETMAAHQGFLDRLQDPTAIAFFNLGEFLAKLFPIVGPGPMQQNIVKWVTQVFTICSQSAEQDDFVHLYIARFYRTVLAHVASTSSVPNTRPSSPNANGKEPQLETYKDPFEDVGWLVQEELESHNDGSRNTALADKDYWQSLFPTVADDVMSWLDWHQPDP
ncbi:hypothetical protein T439DRAFT_152637 [Meredithblackwellia eburnea MCA 4105]